MFGYEDELQDEIRELEDKIRELKAENEKLKLRLSDVSNRRGLLIAFANYCEREWNCTEVPTDVIDEYLESN
jgi:predicted RNase H-like nuclease (RuvC/YqgF family)